MEKWDINYLTLAKTVGSWSKDPSTQVGAVAVGRVGQVLATGYNGFPRGIKDTKKRLNDRSEKYRLVVHAEMNCIYNATYNGISLDGATLYIHGLPLCSDCVKGVIQVGIKRVVMQRPIVIDKLWFNSFEETKELLNESKIKYELSTRPDLL